jgi:two-component system sensor kinase FixL
VSKKRARIAVIDDDTTFLQLMDDLLSGEGYDVLIWRNGTTAYEMVRREKPDLVILDMRMEQSENGWAIMNVIKLDPETVRIPVLVCSADAQALQAQAENFARLDIRSLEKPFNLDDLLAEIAAALGEGGSS